MTTDLMTTPDPRAGGSHRRVDRGRRRACCWSRCWSWSLRRLASRLRCTGAVNPSARLPMRRRRATFRRAQRRLGQSRPGPLRQRRVVACRCADVRCRFDVRRRSPASASTVPRAPPSPRRLRQPPAPSRRRRRPRARARQPPSRSVDILNATHISGMAARADTTLSRGGWVVALTGNYPQSISATTVFYPDGQQAAAQALAAQFTAIGKTAPAPDGRLDHPPHARARPGLDLKRQVGSTAVSRRVRACGAHCFRSRAPTAGIEGLRALIREPSTALIAVDFDGTLAPIVSQPAAARPHPALRRCCASWRHRLGRSLS